MLPPSHAEVYNKRRHVDDALLHTMSILYMIKEILNLYIHTSVIRMTLHIKLTVQTTRYTTSSVPLYKNSTLFGFSYY